MVGVALSVRRAEESDLAALRSLCRLLHEESPRVQDIPLDMAAVEQSLLLCVDQDLGWVLENSAGQPVGLLFAAVMSYWFSRDAVFGSDVLTFIHPDHRARGGFQRLVRAYEQEMASRGVLDVNLSVGSQINAEATVRLLEHMGYEKTTATLRKYPPKP